MRLQSLPALVQRDGVFQVDFALFQAGNDGFELFESALKVQLV